MFTNLHRYGLAAAVALFLIIAHQIGRNLPLAKVTPLKTNPSAVSASQAQQILKLVEELRTSSMENYIKVIQANRAFVECPADRTGQPYRRTALDTPEAIAAAVHREDCTVFFEAENLLRNVEAVNRAAEIEPTIAAILQGHAVGVCKEFRTGQPFRLTAHDTPEAIEKALRYNHCTMEPTINNTRQDTR